MTSNNAASRQDRVVSIKEAAKILNVHHDTVRKLWKTNRLEVVRLSDRRIGVRISEIDRYLNAAVA
jgi:excisionase family DNA binding protein